MQFGLLTLFFACFATLSAATKCWSDGCISCDTFGNLCYECSSGYGLYEASCYQCETNCTSCTAVETNNQLNVVCASADCKASECISCDSTGLLCLECSSGYGLYNYESCHSCPSSCTNCTAVENPNNHQVSTVCGYTSCSGGCTSCDVTGLHCYECDSGYALYDGDCYGCPNNEYESCTDCIAWVQNGHFVDTTCASDSDE